MLHFSDIEFFTNWRFFGNPEVSRSNSTIFPRAYAHFMSLHHILVILQYFRLFHCHIVMLAYDQWSVMILLLFWGFTNHPYKMATLIGKCKRSDCFSDQPFLSGLLDLPLPWDTTMLILGQLITLKLHLNVQIKRRVTCLSLWIET